MDASATTFAITMGLYNFGGQVGAYVGIGLLQALGGVQPPEFVNLQTMLVVQSLSRLLPIGAVLMLVPHGDGPRTKASSAAFELR